MSDDLEGMVKGARTCAELELESAPRRDFDDVWSKVSERADRELEDLDPEFFAWVDAARSEAEDDLVDAATRGIPAMPEVAASDSAAIRPVVWWGVGVAAALLLALFGGRWVLLASQDSTVRPQSQAEMGVLPTDTSTEVLLTSGPGDDGDLGDSSQAEVDDEVEAPVEAEPPRDESKSAPVPAKAKRHKPSVRKSRVERLRELDAEAQSLWRAGDLAGAQSLFEQIVDQGGRSASAELAYGDLFTLARQRGELSLETSLWRGYLRRFPRGQHADDASAGLCRRKADEAAGLCWEDYLKRFATGAHRQQAEKALAHGSPSEVQDGQ